MLFDLVAERQGFEPREVLPSAVFKTAALNRSAISPGSKPTGWSTSGFEWGKINRCYGKKKFFLHFLMFFLQPIFSAPAKVPGYGRNNGEKRHLNSGGFGGSLGWIGL